MAKWKTWVVSAQRTKTTATRKKQSAKQFLRKQRKTVGLQQIYGNIIFWFKSIETIVCVQGKTLVGKGKKPCTEWKNNNLMRHYGFFKLVSWQPRPGPSGRDAHVHSPWRAKMLSSPQSLDEQISLTSLCAKSSPRLWRPGTGTWFFFVSPNYPPSGSAADRGAQYFSAEERMSSMKGK